MSERVFGRHPRAGARFGAGGLFGSTSLSTPSLSSPTIILLSGTSVSEDTALGAIATISANGNPASTFSIIADPDNKFDISGSDLILDGSLDYETKTSHSVTIRATNSEGSHDQAFVIQVTDIDDTAPVISLTDPLDDATNVPVNAVFTITYSEPIQPGSSGTVTLLRNNGGWVHHQVFDVTTDVGSGPGQIEISGNDLIFRPSADLPNGNDFAVQISATAIEDLAGNPFAGISDNTTLNFTTSAAAGSNVTLSPLSTQQYTNIAPIDLTPHTSQGDRLRAINMPEGMEVFADSHRVIGAPLNTQSETNINIHVEAANGPDFWILIPLTVTASSDPVYNVSTAAEIYALAEFGIGYSGPGCVINVAAGATLDPGSNKNSGRFTGLTSPIILKSVDPNDRATWTGKEFAFAKSGEPGTVGNVSFVDLVFNIAQDTSLGPRNPEDTLFPRGCVMDQGGGDSENIAFINCLFVSDVLPASTRENPSESIHGIWFSREVDRMSIINCEFTKMFNAVNGLGDNFLMKGCESYECWGDLFRATTNSVTGQNSYVMVADNVIFNTVADGFLRHADMIQLGGGIAGSILTHYEARGNLYSDSTLRELPTVSTGSSGFTSTAIVDADTVIGTTDKVYYRARTDIANGDITIPLPDPAVVGNGWQTCIMKFSEDETHKVIVVGLDLIYEIRGSFTAVRFYVSGGEWAVHLHTTGVQGKLYQNDGGLDLLENALNWYGGGISGMQHGATFEVLAQKTKLENLTLVHGQFGDVNGDGVVDKSDGMQSVDQPWVYIRNAGLNDVTVKDSVVGDIRTDPTTGGVLTQINNNTDQASASPEITKAFFVGEGRAEGSRLDIIRGMRIKKGSALDGTGIGAVGLGLADGGYDWINKHPRLPGSPNVVTAPIITDTGTSYTISTAAEFSAAVTPTIEWFVDDQVIDGETGSTLLRANVPSDGLIRVRVTGTSSLSPAIVESVNAISHVAAATAPAAMVPANWRAETGSGSQEVDIFIDQAPNDNGAAIDDYEYDIDGSDTWISLGTAAVGQVTVTMAAPLTAYDLRLRAVNSQGAALPSDTKNRTSAGDAPQVFELDDWDVRTGVGPNELEFEVYSLPGQGASPITDIQRDIDGNGTWVSIGGATVGVYSEAMPSPDTSYAIRLRAVNAIGPGDPGNTENAESNSAFAPPTWLSSLVDTTNNSNDHRYARATATLFGQEFMDLANEQQDIDTTKSANMSQATKNALNAAGQFVYIADITEDTDIQAVLIVRGLGDDAYTSSATFNYSIGDWNAAPNDVDHYGWIDVSDLYGEPAGSMSVIRLFTVRTQADQGASPRMYMQTGSLSYDGYYRRMAVFRRDQFSADNATMETEIAGLGV